MLKSLIEKAKTDHYSMMELVERFKPLIRSRAFSLGYDDAEQDMLLEFITLIHAIEISRISSNDGAIVNYIKTAIHNAYMRLGTMHTKEKTLIIPFEQMPFEDTYIDSRIDEELWAFVNQTLNATEYRIIVMSYVDDSSGAEIARHLGITRQAVHKMKKKALLKLRQGIDESELT